LKFFPLELLEIYGNYGDTKCVDEEAAGDWCGYTPTTTPPPPPPPPPPPTYMSTATTVDKSLEDKDQKISSNI
jgi:hypothetical protein